MATNKSVAIAFDIGNVESVVAVIRQKYPNLEIIIAADNDA